MIHELHIIPNFEQKSMKNGQKSGHRERELKVQSSFAETSEDKNVNCKVVVSPRDGFAII
jgi:hypothetical protein